MKNNKFLITGFALFFCVFVLWGCGQGSITSISSGRRNSEEITELSDLDNSSDNDSDDAFDDATCADTDDVSKDKVVVFVCGEVENEGVYELSKNARVADALDAAGGFTDDADTVAVNLALTVEDGEKIYFPKVGEADEALTAYYGEGNVPVESEDNLVDINTASVDELMQLPGIGENKAKSIVEYREIHGRFENTEDITNVSGIGDSIYQKIKDKIRV